MLEWQLDVADIEAALQNCQTIEEYEDGAKLVLGRSGIRPLHLVMKDKLDVSAIVVITVYEPDQTRWDVTFRERKRP